MPREVRQRLIAPPVMAANSPDRPIHRTGTAEAARIEAMKMLDRRLVGHGQRSVAHGSWRKNPTAKTSSTKLVAMSK
jgi:hypothetical protein